MITLLLHLILNSIEDLNGKYIKKEKKYNFSLCLLIRINRVFKKIISKVLKSLSLIKLKNGKENQKNKENLKKRKKN